MKFIANMGGFIGLIVFITAINGVQIDSRGYLTHKEVKDIALKSALEVNKEDKKDLYYISKDIEQIKQDQAIMSEDIKDILKNVKG